MAELKMVVAERELTFVFDLKAWFAVEDKFESLSAMNERFAENKKPMQTGVELAAICATAGERAKGSKQTVTFAWLSDHMDIQQAREARSLAMAAVAQGMRKQVEDDETSEDVDVVAEEIAKKETADA